MSTFFTNTAGAKIYFDIEKHNFLDIPIVSYGEKGVIEEVLSVGFLQHMSLPIVTVKKGKKNVVFRIPDELEGWVLHLILLSNGGIKLLPGKVEFAILDGRTYAEIL